MFKDTQNYGVFEEKTGRPELEKLQREKLPRRRKKNPRIINQKKCRTKNKMHVWNNVQYQGNQF